MSALTAIGSAPLSGSQSAAARPALRAQLSRYEKERSECINCPSAKTLEGKQNIQKLDAAIDSLKGQLDGVRQASSAGTQAGAQEVTASQGSGRIDMYA